MLINQHDPLTKLLRLSLEDLRACTFPGMLQTMSANLPVLFTNDSCLQHQIGQYWEEIMGVACVLMCMPPPHQTPPTPAPGLTVLFTNAKPACWVESDQPWASSAVGYTVQSISTLHDHTRSIALHTCAGSSWAAHTHTLLEPGSHCDVL